VWRASGGRRGLKVPPKQPKRGRLWLNDGSCVRLRASWSNHVWSYDFVEARTHDGRKFRMLCLIDEFTRLASPIWESALAAFGNAGAREIVYLVGYYCFISMILNGFAIPVPDVE
jgi:hypothetical protein